MFGFNGDVLLEIAGSNLWLRKVSVMGQTENLNAIVHKKIK